MDSIENIERATKKRLELRDSTYRVELVKCCMTCTFYDSHYYPACSLKPDPEYPGSEKPFEWEPPQFEVVDKFGICDAWADGAIIVRPQTDTD